MRESLRRYSLIPSTPRAPTLYSFFFCVKLVNKVVDSSVATSLPRVPAVKPAMLEIAGQPPEATGFRKTVLLLLPATLNIDSTQQRPLRHAWGHHFIENAFGIAGYSLYRDYSLSYPIDVLIPSSLAPVQIVQGWAGSVSQDRQHDYIFHTCAVQYIQPFLSILSAVPKASGCMDAIKIFSRQLLYDWPALCCRLQIQQNYYARTKCTIRPTETYI